MSWIFKSGEWNVICDVCGKKIKSSEAKLRWDNAVVCEDDYEPRHILDFIKETPNRITVPFIRRPNDEYIDQNLCTVPGRSGYAGLAVAGCSIAGNDAIPADELLYGYVCTPETRRPVADVGTADCATVGVF